MHLGDHNNTLLEIYHIFNTFKSLTKHDIFELNILKVNCLRYKKYYNEALSINKSMLASLDKDDKENSISVISNILDIYTVLNDIKLVKLYTDKLIYTKIKK